MPTYAKQVEQRKDLFRAVPSRVCVELDACTEVDGIGKSKLKRFLLETGIQSITEMDYPLRQEYKEYLVYNQQIKKPDRYLMAYDRVKQFSIREQMQTLAGRQQNEWRLKNQILFIPYHPDQSIEMEFDSVRNKPYVVWDFTRPCAQIVKEQIFKTLNVIIERYKGAYQREPRLSGLQLLYNFCTEKGVEDIEKLELAQVQELKNYLVKRANSVTRKNQMLSVLNLCRKTIFLQSGEIHWDANIWYLERLNLPKNRINPSGSFNSISFLEITDPENRRYAQEYIKYQISITGMAISTIVIGFNVIRNFLVWLCKRNWCVCDCTADRIDLYIKIMQERNINAKTSNEYLTDMVQFFWFLVVRGYMEKVPFHVEYYQQKVLPKHHDRSVSPEVCEEMLAKLHLLPDHLRCMYLHLWSLGLRISEVCTLKGNAYYQQGQDAWIQVYQIKMKNYKRIPISEGLYKIMQVYIKKHGISPDDYLFTNKKGGPYCSETFRRLMKKFCQNNKIDGGEYLFKSHDYRHTVATLFYDNGVSLQCLRDYLGHHFEEMTEQYIDYVPMKIAKENDNFFMKPDNRLATCLKKGGQDGR